MARFSASPAWSFTSSRGRLRASRRCRSAGGVALRVDRLVDAFQFGDGIAFQRGPVEQGFPAEQQHAELRAPVADVVVGDDAVAEQAQHAREAVAENRGADVADVHRLGDVGRTEIHDDGARLGGLSRRTDARRARPIAGFRRAPSGLSRKFRKPGAGDLDLLAPRGDVESGEHVGGELARIQFARLGQRHQRVALVIAELRVGAGAHEHGGNIGVRQHGADGCLQADSICLCGNTGMI